LTLLGPWSSPVTVTLDGRPYEIIKPSNDRVALQADFSGTQTFVLTP
jgi:hypothetical protein